MPSDFGISALVRDAYDDFIGGIDILSDGAQRDARARAQKRRYDDADVRQVNIPGWDDVLHVGGRRRATEAEREAHYAAKQSGRPSPVDQDVVNELERGARKARSIAASASPAWAQAAGQVLTALDNVQDLTTTIATVGRLTINPAIRAATAASTSRLAVLAVGGRLAAPVLSRFVPVIGQVLLAADLLKLVTQFGMLAFPAYALACGGLRSGLTAALPALLMGPQLCKPIGAAAKINPFGRRAKLSRSRMARNWRPSFSNLIEVAQTTDSLFGVGLSLGALTGTVSDTAFGVEQHRRGKDVRVNLDGFADGNHRVFSGQLKREAGAALHDLRTSAAVLGYAPSLHGTQEDFTVEEHIESLVATTAALSVLQGYILAPEMEAAVYAALDASIEPPRYLEQFTRRSLEDEGLAWPAERRWPLPGSPRAVSGQDLTVITAALVPDALWRLIEPRRDTIAAQVIGALVNQITERSAILLTGSDDAIRYQDAPVYQIMTSLALANRWPNAGDGEGRVAAFFQAADNEMGRFRANSLDAAQLDTLARTVGLQLIRGLPPDAPYPAGFGS